MTDNLYTRALVPLLIAAISSISLVTIWEFWAEAVVVGFLGLPYEEDFERAGRAHFIAVAVGATLLSLIVPAFMLVRKDRRLAEVYRQLVETREVSQKLARHDPLTGLPNRRVFSETLANCIASSGGSPVLLIDLDRFKPVNDIYGHAAGDQVLCELAERFDEVLPQEATMARLGGDEFGIVGPPMATDEIIRLAQRIITAASEPCAVNAATVQVGASVGIALCGADGSEPGEVLRAADLALYRSKEAGRNTFRFFEEAMDREVRDRAALEDDLKRAIRQKEIEPYFQPLVRLRNREITGFEVLSRWNRPGHGNVPPDVFIPVAEEIGQMRELTQGVLRQACLVASGWPAHISLSINVSPRQIQDGGLPGQILEVLAETGFSPSRLVVEITENALVEDLPAARAVLDELTRHDVRIALDDFGTGYSSLYHLRELDFDRIKIDRSFVQSMGEGNDSMKMVDAILSLSHSLELPVTAEGIEETGHMAWLFSHGCEEGQGYLFGKPMSATETDSYLAEHRNAG